MKFQKLKKELKNSLIQLPGTQAQYQMAPSHRPGPQINLNPPQNSRKAAVLVLLYCHNGQIYFPMMRRTPDSGPHSGQISFPGGQCEKSDKDVIYTALRESREEMSIAPDKLDVLAEMSQLYITPSNFLVKPVLAWSNLRPDFVADPIEVAEILEFPLALLFDDKNKKSKVMQVRNFSSEVPYYSFQEKEIWGASAMILSELHQIFRKIPQKVLAECDF